MAYMNQEKKAKIVEQLKKVMPKDWKYSLTVHHHSSITLAIMSAPIDLFARHAQHEQWSGGNIQLNEYYLDKQYSGALLNTFEAIRDAINTGNWDKSDAMVDHFDVGHYAFIHIGKWDKPFQYIPAKKELTYEELKTRIAELERIPA